jgi:hypothetical protein
MSFISKILFCWHDLRKNYHEELINCCIDNKIKAELIKKLEFHKKKVDQILSKNE